MISRISIKHNRTKNLICFFLASIETYCYALSGTGILFALFIAALFFVSANLSIKLPDNRQNVLIAAISAFAAASVILASQIMLTSAAKFIIGKGFVINVLAVWLIMILCILLCGNIFRGILAGTIVLSLFSVIDYMVFSFRGTEMDPLDVLAIGTALNVYEEYSFPFTESVVTALSIVALCLVLVSDFELPQIDRRKAAAIILPAAAVSMALIIILSGTITSGRWRNEGSMRHGVYANYILKLRESRVKRPGGYDALALEKEMSKYAGTGVSSDDDLPNIVVIMNESFADLQQLSTHFKTTEPVMPFFDSLKENAIKGYAYTSVFGGGTSNSEYEFLTGNTMAFLPPGSTPYQQFVKDNAVSVVSVLKKLGYRCESLHPFYANGWNRDKVYPMLGFDDSFFIDYFPEDGYLRSYYSDKAMYKRVIRRCEKKDKKKPAFIFGVTMQNHGSYMNEEFENYIKIKDHEGEYPDAEQYLSIINQSDAALKYLINHFKKSGDRTIVVFFGDHQPGLTGEFYEFAMGKGSGLNYNIEKYKVPFLVWANYDIESKEIERTSINYLSNYLYETAGIRSPYNQVLAEIEREIPAVTAQGYYSVSEGEFKAVKHAEGEEKAALDLYRNLQYNNVFEKKNRLSMFTR